MAVYQPQGSWKAPQKSKINPGTTRKITDEGYDELKDPAKQTPKSNSESERDDSGVDVEEEHARFRPTKKTRTKKLVNWRDVIVNQEVHLNVSAYLVVGSAALTMFCRIKHRIQRRGRGVSASCLTAPKTR